jgi:hypothetical protein
MRFRFIEDRRDDYPVRQMCAVLGVSPAGYYAAWRRWPEAVGPLPVAPCYPRLFAFIVTAADVMAAHASMPSCGRRAVASAGGGSSD